MWFWNKNNSDLSVYNTHREFSENSLSNTEKEHVLRMAFPVNIPRFDSYHEQ
jgi:hypothetical protein